MSQSMTSLPLFFHFHCCLFVCQTQTCRLQSAEQIVGLTIFNLLEAPLPHLQTYLQSLQVSLSLSLSLFCLIAQNSAKNKPKLTNFCVLI